MNPIRCPTEPPVNRVIAIRGLHKDGMSVRQFIHSLKQYPPECKVVIYDRDGRIYPATFTVRDSNKLVAVF